jgi:hypothetical protein
MQWKEPENSSTYYWTSHSKMKMRHYGLSAQRIKRVIRRPLRTELGIADKTVAVMQPQSTRKGENGEKTWTSEIWVMYQISNKNKSSQLTNKNSHLQNILDKSYNKQMKIISAWRYPGKTKKGEGLPDKILEEIAEIL